MRQSGENRERPIGRAKSLNFDDDVLVKYSDRDVNDTLHEVTNWAANTREVSFVREGYGRKASEASWVFRDGCLVMGE